MPRIPNGLETDHVRQNTYRMTKIFPLLMKDLLGRWLTKIIIKVPRKWRASGLKIDYIQQITYASGLEAKHV